MKTLCLCASVAILITCARADTITNVAIFATTGTTNYSVSPAQSITYVGGDGSTVKGYTPAGSFQLTVGQTYTGLTNLSATINATLVYAAFQITTPTPAVNSVTNSYVPADCVMIPTSTTGNCNVILESSADLLNWTAASPGVYGPSSATNRFFRVRLNCQ